MGRRSGSNNSKIFLIVAGVIALAIGVTAVIVVQRNRSTPYRIKKLKAEISIELRRGKPELAAKKLEQLLKLDPSDISQTVLLANVYQQLEKTDLAEELLRDHVGRAPDDLSLAIALGELLLGEDRLPEVLSLLEPKIESLKEHPDVSERSRALILLGQSHTLAGNPQAALPLLTEAVKLRETYGLQASKLETGDMRIKAKRALGDALVAAGRWEDAEQTLREAYEQAPDGIEINLALAHVLDYGGRTEEAVALLERLFSERKESRAEVLPRLGNFLIRINQTERVEALAATLDSAGDSTSEGMAAYLRGLVALDAGQVVSAERELTHMADLLPDSLPARLLLARVALLAGGVDRAEAAYRKALEITPGHAEAELGLLELEEDAGRWASAETRALRLLDRSLTRPAAASLLLRRVASGQDPGPVLAELDRLGEAHPHDVGLIMFAAVFRILDGAESERGIRELAELAERPGVDLGRALGLLAGAQSGTADALEALELLARVASEDPRLTPARVVLASIYSSLGRDDLAAHELDAAIKARPDLVEARQARARLAEATGDLERAAEGYSSLLEHDAQNAQLVFGLADVRLRQGEREAALALFERAAELRPRDAFSRSRLARVRALVGRFPESLAAFQQARRLDASAPASHQDGGVFLVQGDFPAAMRAFRRAATDTKDFRLLACAVLAAAANGELAEAASQSGSLGVDPHWRTLGAALRALNGDPQGAQVALDQAEVQLPWTVARAVTRAELESLRPCLVAGVLEILQWEPERLAIVKETAAASSDPFVLWWCLRALGGTPEGLTASKRLAEAAQDSRSWLRFADEQLRSGDGAGELATLRGLRARFPRDPRVTLRLAMALERESERADAVSLYAQVIAESESVVALNNLAFLLGDDPTQRTVAIGYARRAARLAPELSSVHDTLGWLLLGEGRLHEAEAALQRAVSLAPASPTPRYHLGRTLEARGAKRRAANHYQLCLLTRARFPDREEAKRRADTLRQELAPSESAPEWGLGAPLALTLDEAGLGRARLSESTAGKLVRLRVEGSAQTSILITASGTEGKTLVVGAAQTLELARYRLPRRAGRVALRGEPGATCKLTLVDQADPEAELEPDESPELAQGLAVGGSFAGRFDNQGDLDHVKLDIPRSDAAGVTVKAGTRTALRLDVLELVGGRSRLAKQLRVARGAELVLPPLSRNANAQLVLRLAPDEPVRGLAAAGDYRVSLTKVKASADREPNDRVEHARAIELESEQEAQLGPADPGDWYRLTAPVGTVVRVTLSPQRAAELGLRIWEQGGQGLLPRQLYRSQGTTAAVAPQWRVPSSGIVLISVEGGELADLVDYRLRVERATPTGDGSETEPNDAVEFAESPQPGVTVRGALDGVERDWVKVPALGGGLLRLSLTGSGLDAATVGIYAWFEGSPRLVGRFRSSESGVEVKAMSIPTSSQIAVLLVQGEERSSPYTLTLDAATKSVNSEIEPNDEPFQALKFSSGTLEGTLAGPYDRDVIQVDSGRSLQVRATGPGSVSVRAWDGNTPAVVVPAGEARPLPRESLPEGEDRVLIVVEAPPGEGGVGTSYELSW